MVIDNRLWAIGTAIVVIAILVLGWFLGVSPSLAQAAISDDQRVSVEEQNVRHEATLAELKTQFENIDEYKTELAGLRRAIPAGGDLSTFIGQLQDLEAQSGVIVKSITTTDAVPFLNSAIVTTPAVEAPVDGAETQGGAIETVAPTSGVNELNFVSIEVGLSVSGSREQVLDFVDALQLGSRLYLVTGLSIVEDDLTGTFTASVTGAVYVLLNAKDVPVAAEVDVPATETAAKP